MFTSRGYTADGMRLTCVIWAITCVLNIGCQAPKPVLNQRLYKACVAKDVQGVKDALGAGADANYIDIDQQFSFSVLEVSVESPEIVEILLAAGASPTLPDLQGTTPAYMAAAAGKPGVLDQILKRKVGVETPNRSGLRLLAAAVGGGNVPNVKLLLKAGANVNAVDNSGRTPLFGIVFGPFVKVKDKVEIAHLLIGRGANVKVKDGLGKTVLDYMESKLSKAFDEKGQLFKYLQQESLKVKSP